MTWKIHIYIGMGVPWAFHGCFQAISWVFNSIQGLFQECFDVIVEYVTGVPRVF